MSNKYCFPGNVLSSSLADRDSKVLRLVGTLSFAMHAHKDYKDAFYPFIESLAGIGELTARAGAQCNNYKYLKSLSNNFIENIKRKIGILPDSLMDCIRLDVDDLLGLPVSGELCIDIAVSPRHYYRHSLASIQDSLSAPYYAYDLWTRMGRSPLKPSLALTPLTQISIGHLYYVPLAITYASEIESRGIEQPVQVIISPHGYGIDFYYRMLKAHPANLRIHSIDSVWRGHIAPCLAWQSEAWAACLGPRRLAQVEDKIHSSMNICIKPTNLDVVFHLRTGSWKRDNSFNSHRDCDPVKYISLIQHVAKSKSYVVITGDADLGEYLHLHGVAVHLVSNRETSYKQWDLIAGAKLIVGSASGISHLESISSAPILYLNVLSQMNSTPIKKKHMFSIRGIHLKCDRLCDIGISRNHFFHGILSGYDEGRKSFGDWFEVRHLDAREMISDYAEATSSFEHLTDSYPYTNKKLAIKLGLEYDGPTRNLTRESFFRLKSLCELLPK
jgi:hypothetical protein